MLYNMLVVYMLSLNTKDVRDRCETEWFWNSSCSSSSSSSNHCRPRKCWSESSSFSRGKRCPSFPRPQPSPLCKPSCFPKPSKHSGKGKGHHNPIFWKLERLAECKSHELRLIFAGFSRRTTAHLSGSLREVETQVNAAVDASYAALNKSFGALLTASNQANKNALSTIISDTNTVILNGVQGLVSAATASLDALITNLAGLNVNQLVLIVQDLVGPTGLLSQVNAILNVLSTGIQALLLQTTPQEIINVNNALNTSATALQTAVNGLIAQTNTDLGKALGEILAKHFADLGVYLKHENWELLQAVEKLFNSYVCDVSGLVSRLPLKGGDCDYKSGRRGRRY